MVKLNKQILFPKSKKRNKCLNIKGMGNTTDIKTNKMESLNHRTKKDVNLIKIRTNLNWFPQGTQEAMHKIFFVFGINYFSNLTTKRNNEEDYALQSFGKLQWKLVGPTNLIFDD